MRSARTVGEAAAFFAEPSLGEALAAAAWETLELFGWMLVCGLIIAIPVCALFVIMCALSKLADRIRSGRPPR